MATIWKRLPLRCSRSKLSPISLSKVFACLVSSGFLTCPFCVAKSNIHVTVFLPSFIPGNKLDKLPDALDDTLDNLETLDLSDNNLRHIPKSMCDFPKLGQVDLQVRVQNNHFVPGTLNIFWTFFFVMRLVWAFLLQFNPISGDLSDYISILVKCANLKSLLWPKTTMRCTCSSMKQYSAEYSPQFAIPAKYR